MKNLENTHDMGGLIVLVHPFSNRTGIYLLKNRHPKIKFKREEENYFLKIERMLKEDSREIIITQPLWDLERLQEYIKTINSQGKRDIIATPGDSYTGDNPTPYIGWKDFNENLSKRKEINIIVCGAQLGIFPSLFFGQKYGYCVGTTYNEIKKGTRNKHVFLEKDLCLVYNKK